MVVPRIARRQDRLFFFLFSNFPGISKTSVMSVTGVTCYSTLYTAIYEFQVHGVTGFRLLPR